MIQFTEPNKFLPKKNGPVARKRMTGLFFYFYHIYIL